MKTVIFIPTYNERENVPKLIEALDGLQLSDTQYLFVDDTSPDGTGELLDTLAKTHPGMTVIHRMKKDGLGRAYIAGFQAALKLGADRVILMDADLSHDPNVLPLLLQKSSAADLVIGSRYIPNGGIQNWNAVRRMVSFLGNLYARTVLGVRVRDLTTGYVCFSRAALLAVDLDNMTSNGYVMNIEIKYRIIKKGFTAVEVPIIFTERKIGKSKFTLLSFLEAFVNIVRLKFQRSN